MVTKKKQMIKVKQIGGNSISFNDIYESNFVRIHKALIESSSNRINTIGKENLENADDLNCLLDSLHLRNFYIKLNTNENAPSNKQTFIC